MAGRPPPPQKTLNRLRRQIDRRQTLVLKPAANVRQPVQVGAHRAVRIASTDQLLAEPIRVQAQRPYHPHPRQPDRVQLHTSQSPQTNPPRPSSYHGSATNGGRSEQAFRSPPLITARPG